MRDYIHITSHSVIVGVSSVFRVKWWKSKSGTSYSNYSNTFDLIYSPTGNCQLSSFRLGYHLTLLDKKQLLYVLYQLFVCRVSKKMVLFDVREEKIELLRKALKPYIANFNTKKYISSNASKMAIILVKLDKTNIKTAFEIAEKKGVFKKGFTIVKN